VVADLLIVKKWLKIGPRRLEYARSRLRLVTRSDRSRW
jgi:hypothetical protein